MEVKQLLKEYRLLKYIDENKANKNVAILLVSRLKELGINEDEQYSLLADLYDKAILQRLNETEIFVYGKAGGEDLGEDLVKLQLTLAALSYPKPCPNHIVKIIPERFYPHLEDTKKEYEEKKSELAESEDKKVLPYKVVRGTKWENVVIKFLDEERVEIQVNQSPKIKHKTNFKEMRFEGRGGKPSVQWIFLKVLANHNGEINWEDKEANIRFKKQAQLLAKGLQNYFKLDYDPFYVYKEVKTYKVKMVLIPPPKKKPKPKPDEKEYDRDDDIREFYNEITK